MNLLHPSASTLRRYSLALLGLLVVAGKAFGLALTTEDLGLTLAFLSATIVTSNAKAMMDAHAASRLP